MIFGQYKPFNYYNKKTITIKRKIENVVEYDK